MFLLSDFHVAIQEHISSNSPVQQSQQHQNQTQYAHYAIVIDAGSSGSRAYLYAWPSHSGNLHDLLRIRPLTVTKMNQPEPLVEKVTPGLSR